MKLSTAEKVNVGFLLALVAVAAIGIASYTSIRLFVSTAREVSRAHSALTELHSMLANLTLAESAQRGYVISGDDEFLEPYASARDTLIEQIDRLQSHLLGDEDHASDLTELRELTQRRIAFMGTNIAVRRGQGPEAAAALVRAGLGREVMDSIRDVVARIEDSEQSHLSARNRSAERRAGIALYIIGGGGIFAFLVVLAATFTVRRDYAERLRAEAALRESETLLSQFMENLPIGVLVVDHEWRRRFANNAAIEILGTDLLLDDTGTPLPVYRTGDHTPYPEAERPLARALMGERVSADDTEVLVKDEYIPIAVSAAPIYDARGRIAYAIAAFNDVTERRRGEEALRSAKDAAEAASRTKSDFLARMSHELRTPLNSVIGFANIMLKNKAHNLRDQDLAYLERILDNGKHLLLLINDILDLSKIEAGKIEIEHASVDLTQLVTGVVRQWDGQLKQGAVDMRMEVPEDLDPVITDASRMRQILINLIGNAVKFTEQGTITVAIDVKEGTNTPLCIRVVDTGIGIPEDRLDAIFDAFEQAESTTARKYGGTGLGLPISRALCELLGYRLEVTSEAGKGTTFSVNLLPAEIDDAAARVRARIPVDTVTVQAGRRERLVLIIDDDTDARTMLTHYVEEFGCRAIAADSGDTALTLARELRPDLITIDLLMPELNGWDLLAALKEDPGLAEIPVIVVSALAEENRNGLVGAIDLLQKPIDRDALFAVLRRNLGSQRARILVVEDDADTRVVLRDMLEPRASDLRTAINGEDALTVLRHFDPDVVILDLLMPSMDGMTFLEIFRSTPRFQHVPVIVVTSKDLTSHERDRLARHTSAVLRKGRALEDDLRRVFTALLVRPGDDAPSS